MKRISIIFLILSGCGSDPAAIKADNPEPTQTISTPIEITPKPPCADSSLIGVWVINNAHVIFNDDCSWTSSDCHESGTYQDSSKNPATIDFTISKSDCTTIKEETCNYDIKSDTLYWNCQVK